MSQIKLERGFKPKTDVTDEENEERISQLEEQLQQCEVDRDYEKADKLQLEYDYCMKVRAFFNRPKVIDNTLQKLEQLENARVQEEDELNDEMCERIDVLISNASDRLDEIEQRHTENLDRLDKRFDNPHFAALRLSPDVQALMKAEAYYVRQKNYKLAAAYKFQITNRTEHELNVTDQAANQTVVAAIEAAVRKYEYEKKGLHQKLENDQLKMRREAEKILLGIKFRYQKLRHAALGLGKTDPLPEEARETPKVLISLVEKFAPILKETESTYVPVSPVEPPVDSRPFLMAKSRQINEPRTRGMNSVRNPRVQRAIGRTANRSMTRSMAQTM
ncbi:hypothetical protein TRFO_29682 [Tritrichomonas foetus]|uniref:Uncharacterized protein n=1 Tax=Tritrichomonas foetus TaxID=1144522 RepID=A0A1J4JWD8_9EUKA|nr:hypothetical protein TRFO_29682 [Tritrichomonas foetus]|eukprot:OHT03026.1 hypothetical protein TRFO_29682 [Tritrichomonas foetus]